MRLPNLIETRGGRLLAFFFLYVTEGIPLGFCATAIATQMRRQDVGPAEIGAFVGSLYLPWAVKWLFGPFIDVFTSERLGRRRGWILGTQVMLVLTLLGCSTLQLPQQLGLLTGILLIHNSFGAMQDVAIDALAINVLPEEERGLASGVMFGGQAIGMAVGGSGVLFLMPVIGVQGGFLFVAAAITLVTLLVVLPLREPGEATRRAAGWAAAVGELKQFCVTAFRSFVGTRGAFAALGLALLPQGAMSLGLALQSNLSVEIGMNDDQIAWLSLWSQVIGAAATVAGGWVSDHLGRRRTTFLFFALMSLPVIYLMQVLLLHHHIMPVPKEARGAVPPALVTAMWISSLAYAVAQGAMYGASTALYMDVTNPRVAGTQFTAYMAMNNVGTSYSAVWQGVTTETLGYPKTLMFDALTGLLCLLLVPLVKPLAKELAARNEGDGHAPGRARALAIGLGLGCLAWLPWRWGPWQAGELAAIFDLFFTLVFVAAAVFLGVSLLVGEGTPPLLRRASAITAPLLLAMYLRTWWPQPEWPYSAVALLAGVLLLWHARRRWQGLAGVETTA
jgi:PAT family beta-lactamase induction signal transducer AmpG